MSKTLYRHLYLSATQRIPNVMTLQHLSTRAGPQHVCQHTLRTAAGLANARGIPLTRPCLHFAPSAQLHFGRGLFTRSGLQSLSASQAEESETAESEHRLAGSDLVDSTEVSTQQTSSTAEPQQAFPGVQADSGIEVVSEGVPTEAVLSASVLESNTSPSVQDSTSAESSAAASPGDWESLLQAFLDIVIEGNHFEGRPPKADAFSISILKRGILNFARARQDILFSLPEEKIRAVLAAGPPYQERKMSTASKRLATTFGEEKGFLGQPEGSFQDLTRFIIAAAYSHSMHKGRVANVKDTDLVDWNSHQYNEALMTAMTSLLPDIIEATRREPDPQAVAKAEASALVREQKAITPAASLPPKQLRPSNASRDAPTGDRRQDRSRFFMEKGWEGFTDPNSNIKPGDWTCGACNQHNFARNTECFKCGAPKSEAAEPAQFGGERRMSSDRFSDRRPQADRFPQTDGFGAAEAMPEGDWDCSECGTNNFARRGKCFKCGRPRAKGMVEGQRPGDWCCPSCSANNFSRRTECFRCQQPKPEDQGYRAQSRRDNFAGSRDRGSFERPVYEAKPGDWDCSACGASNFARRGLCFKCGEPKSGGASGMTTSGRSAGRVFNSKQDESSWFDADDSGDASSSSSSAWDPRTSLGSESPQSRQQDSPDSFDRGTPRRDSGAARGSDWSRGGASMSRGGRGGSSSRGGRGGSSYGSSSRGGGSQRGASRGRGYSSQSGRGGRDSAESRNGGSFSGYSRDRDIITGEPINNSKSRSFSQDSFGGEWGDLE
ncbi:hypothetical protein ABBQ38_007313 [Trebouxia sp. C0009 RCD-2024]